MSLPLSLAPSRSPWQLLYGAGHSLRAAWYQRRARRLPRPVVSVGNLLWGGAGKTPLVVALARHLRDRGLAVTVLSRGYRSRGHGVRVVSTGGGPLLGPLVAGDEPVLLAGELPGVAVVVDPDRHRAGLHALERLEPAPQLFLLDDGFSHLRLHRDLHLLVFPGDDPFGGGRLAPAGRLREPLASSRRAHAALLSPGEPEDGGRLAALLRPFGFRGPAFTCSVDAEAPRLGHDQQPLPADTRVLLVSAIARPARFRTTAEAAGLAVAGELALPDHHSYPRRTLERIGEEYRRLGAGAVLTTAKDQVKLLGRLELPLAVLPIRLEPEPAFWSWLDPEIDRLVAA